MAGSMVVVFWSVPTTISPSFEGSAAAIAAKEKPTQNKQNRNTKRLFLKALTVQSLFYPRPSVAHRQRNEAHNQYYTDIVNFDEEESLEKKHKHVHRELFSMHTKHRIVHSEILHKSRGNPKALSPPKLFRVFVSVIEYCNTSPK